jgi:putative PEP-CTERM system TPR-repeat lipoprotein
MMTMTSRSTKYWPRALAFAVTLGLAPVALSVAASADTSEASSYLQNAQALMTKGDLRGASIELRNAARVAPNNADIHLELAKIYLMLSNLPSAEAEARTALQRNGDEGKIAPVLAEILLRAGKYEALLRDVPAGNRPAAEESAVRLYRGHAYISLHQLTQAEPLMRDAERLDPNSVGAKLGMARLLMAEGKATEGEQEIDQALKVAPRDSHAEIAKADILRSRGDADGALAYLNDVLSREPQNMTARLGRVNLLIAKNQMNVASQEIHTIIGEMPDNFQANYLQALVDARQGHLDQAYARLQKYVERFRDFPAGYLLLGDVEFAQGKLSEAEDSLTKFLGRVPNNAMAIRLVAEIALRNKNPGMAVQYLEPLVKVTPGDNTAWVLLANAYLAQGKSDKASAALAHASAQGSSDPSFETELASTRYAAGQTDAAIEELEQAFRQSGGEDIAGPSLILADLRSKRNVEAAAAADTYAHNNPNNPVALNLLGLTRVAQSKFADAEQIFASLYRAHPDFTVAGHNLAEVYLAQGRTEDATAIYRDLVHRNPADTTSMMALSNIALSQRDVADAIGQLKQATIAAPKDPLPALRLANLYAGQKDWNDAVTVMRGLVAQFPNNLDVLDLMARIQIATGDMQGAVATYRRATEIGSTMAVLFERYAAALVAANDPKNGRDAMLRAIRLDPGNTALKAEEVEIEYKLGGVAAAQAAAKSMLPPNADPNIGTLWVAAALAREGKVADAESLLAAAEKSHPESALVMQHGMILAANGDTAKGAALLKSWVAGHPTDDNAHRMLADLEMQVKDWRDAQTDFESLLAKSPNDVVLLNDLAWVYLQQGNVKARTVADRAHALAPLSAAVEDTLGWVMLAQGDAKGGLPYLKAAAYGMPQDPAVQFHLAVALSRTGAMGPAREMLAKLATDGNDADTKAQASQYLQSLNRN